jgi:hypothetical protein
MKRGLKLFDLLVKAGNHTLVEACAPMKRGLKPLPHVKHTMPG